MEDSKGLDIPLSRLRPLRERKVQKREYDRILASIKAVGLIEPLIVYPDGDGYVVLDGVQRYKMLLELGVEVAPCIQGGQREAFTGNRMVNRVSPVQEHRMIQKSLTELDEKSIADALGVISVGHRLKKTLLKQLHPAVAAALDVGKINQASAKEFVHVKQSRQKEILDAMEAYKDYSIVFVRTQIVKTPPQQREARGRKNNPWDKTAHRKNDLFKRLTETEQKHDFYVRLYKQYTMDLLRMAIYARSLLTNTRVCEYLEKRHHNIKARFEAVIADARG